MMTPLDKLHTIEEAKTIYNIHYCNAGIGFQFFYGNNPHADNFKDYLTVDMYYPSLEEAIEGEWKRLLDDVNPEAKLKEAKL